MENTRRDFLKTASAVAAAGTVIAAPLAVPAQAAAAVATAGAVTEHKLPPLPYDYNALEPFID
ncbi:MAG: twin-arginine translocation signal domain-containing protein, partial [Candidatus Hydrogenedentes bacterium]|nr:twin-arginine translocation signal domain-containing protein [Candidatus Hydrogenedentota bacterium]